VTVNIFKETAPRYRHIFRALKFHRLICDVQANGPDGYTFQLDGPLSLFSSTQRYGMQLSQFLPTIFAVQAL